MPPVKHNAPAPGITNDENNENNCPPAIAQPFAVVS